jgi:hypothetical protein
LRVQLNRCEHDSRPDLAKSTTRNAEAIEATTAPESVLNLDCRHSSTTAPFANRSILQNFSGD